jgi:hypothetical protein
MDYVSTACIEIRFKFSSHPVIRHCIIQEADIIFFCTRVGLLPPGANPIAVKIITIKNPTYVKMLEYRYI